MHSRLRALLVCLALICMVVPAVATASGPVTGTFKVVIVRVRYSDSPSGHTYTNAQMDQAMGEFHNFFSELSYGALDMQLSWKDVTLSNNTAHYWYSCPNPDDASAYCVKDDAFRDAAEAAAVAGADFTDVKTMVLLSPCGTHDRYANWTAGADIGLSSSHVHRTVHKVSDTECAVSDPALINAQASGVWWGGWAHELGHTVQLEGHDLFDHPSGYASGYDLMDSCYPCGESVYSRSGSPVVSDTSRTSFPEWLLASKTLTIPRPTSGSAGGTYVLEPVSKSSPGSTVAYRGIKLPLGGDHYFMVDARVRTGADTHNVLPGLYDEGIQIQDVVESRNPPVRNIWSCDTTVSGGCISTNTDSRIPACHTAAKAGDQPDYCWPFPLFHPGNTWYDATSNVSVHVLGRVGDGYGVTVTRGVAPGHPDVFIYPWLTAPMNTYETVDIWVDSSCNGYEADVGAAGLRYGRRPDGTVIGNGDDPCANHENRIYAHVRNGGDATAVNAHVRFLVTDPPGVGVRGATGWLEVGSVTIPSLAPGASQDVFVNWTPHVTLTPAQISEGHFNFHTCVQIKIDAVAGEVILSNQDGDGEQENFDHFEAVHDTISGGYHVPDRDFYLFNHQVMDHQNLTGAPMPSSGLPRHFQLRVKSELPPDWTYQVAGGETELVLAPEEVRKVPVKVIVPPGTPVARTFFLRVTAFTPGEILNRMVLPTSPAYRHYGWHQVAGVVEAVQTVDPSTITLTAEYKCPDSHPTVAVLPGTIRVKGHLDPVHVNTVVAIDYTPPGGGATVTHLVHTDSGSNFEDALPASTPGDWVVRALWQGDMDHSSSVSDLLKVDASPRDCKPSIPTPPQTAPPNSTILVPDAAFPGGLLTGIVFGPDGEPARNTSVEIAGGVPATLSGEVIGEPEPCPANDPKCQPQRPQTPQGPPVDCSALLRKVREAASNPSNANPAAANQPAITTPALPGKTPGPPQTNVPLAGLAGTGPSAITDANGRFALCMLPDVPSAAVNLPGGANVPIKVVQGQPALPAQPPDFFQPGQKVSIIGVLRDPKLAQAGRTWLLPAVQAWSPNGQQMISAFKTPNNLMPGPAQLSYVGGDGQTHHVQGTVFRIVRAFLDRTQLRSQQGATFEYDVQFAPQAGQNLCVKMRVAGPVELVQAPPTVIPIDANGLGKFTGKIRAVQVAPGTSAPFDLSPDIHVCTNNQ